MESVADYVARLEAEIARLRAMNDWLKAERDAAQHMADKHYRMWCEATAENERLAAENERLLGRIFDLEHPELKAI
jgi:hypothetical protein